VIVTRTLAALIVVLMLAFSVSSAVCDGSCAFSQTQANDSIQMPMAMDHGHCDHVASAVPVEHTMIQGVSSCPDHRCGDPATLSVQKLRPASPQLSVAALTVVAHLERRDVVSVTEHSPVQSLTFVRPDTPSTSLRV
jgi:hypothetical protein